jgi:hypothetical protein
MIASVRFLLSVLGTLTNHLDIGATTNFPSRYYRARFVP